MRKLAWKLVLGWVIIAAVAILTTGRVYLSPEFPHTHDGENHLARFANYKLALKQGQFPPRLAPNLLNGYSYPVFNYNYPLANILSVPFSAIKINYELSFKLLALASLIGGVIGTDLWLRQLKFGRAARLFSLLGFISTPYLINLIWFRGNIGELLALGLFPWALWLTDSWAAAQTKKTSWWLILVGGGILLAHNITAMLLVPILLAYGWLRISGFSNLAGWKARLKLDLIWLASLTLCLWFWLPAIMEKSAIVLDNLNFSAETSKYFSTLNQIISSPVNFGFAYPGSVDNLSANAGILTWLSLGLTGIWLIILAARKKLTWNDLTLGFLWLSCSLLIWLQTSGSSQVWQIFAPLKFVQFPWRLGLPVAILVLPILATNFENFSKSSLKWLLVVGLGLQFWSIFWLSPAGFFHHSIQDYDLYPQTTSTMNENLPKGYNFIEYGELNRTPIIFTGQGEIKVALWSGTTRKYQLKLTEPSLIIEPSIVFPGFETRSNGQKLSYINSDQIQGRLAYQLPAGDYQITTQFTQNTWPRQIGNLISLITWLGLTGWGWKIFKSKNHAKTV